MAKFPEPPSIEELTQIEPDYREIEPHEFVSRIFFTKGRYPCAWHEFRYFGPTKSRFDHQLPNDEGESCPQDRGIMYLGFAQHALPVAAAEFFQSTRVIDRRRNHPSMVSFQFSRTVKLLDISGAFATRMGASGAISSGLKPRARRWAKALYEAFPEAEGLFYRSSMCPDGEAIALFERAAGAIPQYPMIHRSLADESVTAQLRSVAYKIGYRLTHLP